MEEPRPAVGQGRRGGIFLVTAAPGDGKSQTALEAERVLSEAFGTQGYAFLLPTMATSDQMHGRVAKTSLRQAGEEAGLTLVRSNPQRRIGSGPPPVSLSRRVMEESW
ncbi:hypothetical protein [Streptomyces pilosus]|nr:hypothetical protein [Streptomyces pilosus]